MDITIGSDIEYLFIKKGKPISFPEAVREGECGNVGQDHNGKVGEIRGFFGSVEHHFKEIKKELEKIIEGKKLKKGVEMNASHIINFPPHGGHIHFSVKADSEELDIFKTNLNYWLALTVQPLFPKKVFIDRLKSNYGRLSDLRAKSHGFEYRTLPSFIFDRKVTLGILALAYAIVSLTVENKLKTRNEMHDLEWINMVANDYYHYDIRRLKSVRKKNIETILKKGRLGGLLKYISPLFKAIQENRKYSGDIAEGWGMDYNYVLNSRNKDISNEQYIQWARTAAATFRHVPGVVEVNSGQRAEGDRNNRPSDEQEESAPF